MVDEKLENRLRPMKHLADVVVVAPWAHYGHVSENNNYKDTRAS
jgi:hypothetical protein